MRRIVMILRLYTGRTADAFDCHDKIRKGPAYAEGVWISDEIVRDHAMGQYERFFKIIGEGPHEVPIKTINEAKGRLRKLRTEELEALLADARQNSRRATADHAVCLYR